MPRQGFANQADCPRVYRICGTAVRFASNRILKPSCLAELANEPSARGIHSLNGVIFQCRVAEIPPGPLLQFQRQCFVTGFKKWPIEMVRAKNFSLP